MNILRLSSGYGILLLGIAHIALTSKNYVMGSEEALWFAGTGTMLIAAGIFVIAADRNATRTTCYGATIVCLLGLLLAIWSISVLGDMQTFVLALLFVGGFISCGWNALEGKRQPTRSDPRASSTFRRER